MQHAQHILHCIEKSSNFRKYNTRKKKQETLLLKVLLLFNTENLKLSTMKLPKNPMKRYNKSLIFNK